MDTKKTTGIIPLAKKVGAVCGAAVAFKLAHAILLSAAHASPDPEAELTHLFDTLVRTR